MARPGVSLFGKRFGRLVVIRSRTIKRKTHWVCLCDCGIKKTIATSSLTKGVTRSCGCLYRESRHTIRQTHGQSGTPEYIAWSTMKARCYNKANADFHIYGGRGIRVATEWKTDFAAFLAHVGQRPSRNMSIDRIDSNGNYVHGNVRWATMKEQGNNKRNNRLLTYQGSTDTLSSWADKFGIKQGTLKQRLRYGWSIDRALTEPVRG